MWIRSAQTARRFCERALLHLQGQPPRGDSRNAGLLVASRAVRILAGAMLGIAVGLVVVAWGGAPLPWIFLFALAGTGTGAVLVSKSVKELVSHGSARLATPAELMAMSSDGGLVIGRASTPERHLLRYQGPGHLVTIAPTRAGKGVGAVIPNLLLADRPVLVIDPKGENYDVTGEERRKYGPVYRLDPFGVCGEGAARFNPFDGIRMESDSLVDDVATLTAAIVYDPPDQVREAHWNGEASALVSGLILSCLHDQRPSARNLGQLRECLTLPPDEFRDLMELMQKSTDADGLVARAANRRLSQNDREAASILSTAQRHTHFLDSANIVRSTDSSGFCFRDVVEQNGTVYLILPPDRIATYARWLRIIVSQAISELVRMKPKEGVKPLLFLLDECAALGRMTSLERAVGLMAGYGMQIWCVFQDIHQMRSTYGTGAGTILSNAGIVQVFNVNDIETARWLSSTLGTKTESYSAGGPAASARTARSLLTPDEILNLPSDSMLLVRQEGRPVLARKVRYYEDCEFEGLARLKNETAKPA